MMPAPTQPCGLCVSDLEQFPGISIVSLCSAWRDRTPDDMHSVLSGYKTLGGTKIPDGAWADLGTLADVCMGKAEPEATP